VLLLVVGRLDARPPAPPFPLRPRHAGPVVVVQTPLPRPPELEAGDVALRLGPGMVVGQPRAQLVAELLLLRCRGQIHGAGRLLPGRTAPAMRGPLVQRRCKVVTDALSGGRPAG